MRKGLEAPARGDGGGGSAWGRDRMVGNGTQHSQTGSSPTRPPCPVPAPLGFPASFTAPSRQTSILSIHTGIPDPNLAMKPRDSFHPTHNRPSAAGPRNCALRCHDPAVRSAQSFRSGDPPATPPPLPTLTLSSRGKRQSRQRRACGEWRRRRAPAGAPMPSATRDGGAPPRPALPTRCGGLGEALGSGHSPSLRRLPRPHPTATRKAGTPPRSPPPPGYL